MKIIFVNCGVKNYMTEDHYSYRRNCKSCVYNCDDLLSYNDPFRPFIILHSTVHIYDFHIFITSYRVFM